MAVVLGIKGVYAMAGVNSGSLMPGRPVPAVSNNLAAVPAPAPSTPAAPGPAVQTSAPPRERVILVTPGRVKTTQGVYGQGSFVGTNRVRRVGLDGFEFEGGERIPFARAF